MSGTETLHSAEAGHWGKDVRSDVHVAFEARDIGGLEISLESRVAPYYGSAILEQAREVLGELGVRHARVKIRDEGALPYTIGARLHQRGREGASPQGAWRRRALGLLQHLFDPGSRRGSGCGARACISRVLSRNISSTLRSTDRMR